MSKLLYRNLKILSEDKSIPKEVWNEGAIKIFDICEANTVHEAVGKCRPIVTDLNSVFEAYSLPLVNTQKNSRDLEKEIRHLAKKCGISFYSSALTTQLV